MTTQHITHISYWKERFGSRGLIVILLIGVVIGFLVLAQLSSFSDSNGVSFLHEDRSFVSGFVDDVESLASGLYVRVLDSFKSFLFVLGLTVDASKFIIADGHHLYSQLRTSGLGALAPFYVSFLDAVVDGWSGLQSFWLFLFQGFSEVDDAVGASVLVLTGEGSGVASTGFFDSVSTMFDGLEFRASAIKEDLDLSVRWYFPSLPLGVWEGAALGLFFSLFILGVLWRLKKI